ncbi:MAG TPA: hypothetical protein VGH65_07945 [Verrucomicrobiaceae bacterium]|jgi:hypothetical protein
MSANQSRGTPGLLLLVFACALLLTAAGAWEWRRQVPGPTGVVALSGVGDANFYTALSENDFARPALVFSQAPEGLFRLTVEPEHHDDTGMRRVEIEHSGRFVVYTEAHPSAAPEGAQSRRWFLKAAGNQYVGFGAKK